MSRRLAPPGNKLDGRLDDATTWQKGKTYEVRLRLSSTICSTIWLFWTLSGLRTGGVLVVVSNELPEAC